MTALGSFLVDAGPPARADMAVVLAGDHYGRRILKAAELVKQGFAPQALVSGPENCCYGVYESELAIAFAVRHGYPQQYFISVPNPGLSTREEATFMIAELRKHNAHRIDVVTSDYHTRRAGRIYRSLAPDLEIHMVAAPDQYFAPERWWKTREGEKTFVQEWAKTVTSWFGI
jgi:uncharacterized SAM-binding protein YcdF (DUF218 family)